jgi:hypothetical protein
VARLALLLILLTAAALACVGFAAPAAPAHGPCLCTTPIVRPGQLVPTGRAYLVVWNPAPHWFGGGAGGAYLASAHRPLAPSGVVFERPRPPHPRVPPRERFRVPPSTPPGVYLALVFDGSEGGTHATWDHVQVIDPRTLDDDASAGALHVELARLRDVFPLM